MIDRETWQHNPPWLAWARAAWVPGTGRVQQQYPGPDQHPCRPEFEERAADAFAARGLDGPEDAAHEVKKAQEKSIRETQKSIEIACKGAGLEDDCSDGGGTEPPDDKDGAHGHADGSDGKHEH